MPLSAEELARYSRHLLLPEMGRDGQEKIKDAKVLIIGTGGLGSPIAMYLAAAGVGVLGIADFDRVDLSNLQRQLIHETIMVGKPKVESARQRIHSINPHVQVVPYETSVNSKNIRELFEPYDVIIDGSDNFPTRYLVNDACVLLHKPLIYGAIYQYEGHASVFLPGTGPCYRCLYPEPPNPKDVPNCSQVGVFSVLPGIIGLIQAAECLKRITQIGTNLIGRLLILNSLDMKFREIKIPQRPGCEICGSHPKITDLIEYNHTCDMETDSQHNLEEPLSDDITAIDLKNELTWNQKLVLLDVREQQEWELGHLPYALHIPFQQLPQRLNELPPEDDYLIYCHTGIRSRYTLEYLKEKGFQKVRNLYGGIDTWSIDVDSSLPRY